MPKVKVDPRVDKRRVTMRSVSMNRLGEIEQTEKVDYVRPDHLDAYLADARQRFQYVEVSEEPDAGPGGYEGATHVPEYLDVPDAGVTYPAIEKG